MTFNIGNQTGGVVNNVAGDQTVHGDQHGVAVTDDEARRAAGALIEAVRRGDVDPEAAAGLPEDLDDVVHDPQPDKPRIADWLTRLARGITTVGGWAKAGAAVVASIRTLAIWLGPLGAPVLGLLPALL